jgi:putative ABC transport system permease protein
MRQKFRGLSSFFSVFIKRSQLEKRMDVEMRFHMESYTEDLVRQGMTREDASRRAQLEFGTLEAKKEECREAQGLRWPSELAQDLAYAVRTFRKNPGFTCVAIATLALGIGANTSIFSVVSAVILRPLPYPDAPNLVQIRECNLRGESFSVAWPNFEDWRSGNHSFTAMAAVSGASLELTGVTHPTLVGGEYVSSSFFDLLGVRPTLGRSFTWEDDRPGAEPVVVLGNEFWLAAFGGDRSIVGKPIVLSGTAYTVIGVLDPFFSYAQKAGVYLPIGTRAGDPQFNNRAAHRNMHVIARVASGKTLEAASADLDSIMVRLERQYPDTNKAHRASMTPLIQVVTGNIRPVLYVLLTAAGLVLLIACVNVANLLLARGSDRRREFAIRVSLGAGKLRLARQMMTESMLLALMGGAAGVSLAAAALRPLLAFAPKGIPRIEAVRLDPAMLWLSLAISVTTGLLFGLAPSFHAWRTDLTGALKDGGRGASAGRARLKARAGLLLAEMSLAGAVLLVCLLMVRSLFAALNADPGFRPDHLVALEITFLSARYKHEGTAQAFLAEATRKLRLTPGIQSAGAVTCPPFAADCGDYWYEIPGRTHFTPGNADDSLFNRAGVGYFSTIGAPILEGRDFSLSDAPGSPRVAIVNRTLARKWWPKDTAVGWRIKRGGPGEPGDAYEIVGVVGDVNREGLDTPPQPEIFLAAAQELGQSVVLVVRSPLDPAQAAASAERAIHSIDKDLPVRVAPVTKTMAESMATRKYLTALLSVFGILALVLASVGIFGVMAYQVAQRTHEIGVRKALGATRGQILGLFVRRAILLALTGAAVGVAGALTISHLLQGLLFGVKPWDPATLALTPLVLAVLAIAACSVPARRAASIDAMSALRQE